MLYVFVICIWLLFSGETVYKADSAIDNGAKVAQHFPILNYILNCVYFVKSGGKFYFAENFYPVAVEKYS